MAEREAKRAEFEAWMEAKGPEIEATEEEAKAKRAEAVAKEEEAKALQDRLLY